MASKGPPPETSCRVDECFFDGEAFLVEARVVIAQLRRNRAELTTLVERAQNLFRTRSALAGCRFVPYYQATFRAICKILGMPSVPVIFPKLGFVMPVTGFAR